MEMLGFVRFVFLFFTSVERPEDNSVYFFKVISVLPWGSEDLSSSGIFWWPNSRL